ncbi:MAG: WbqC family protein [Deltaproteobacteria bacterium]|nr:WbqC family protein [Deltaproteobacteria bacterium]
MTTIITGHQPAYLPWIGLFHKIGLADIFIYMDDVQYLTRDFNNRNRIKTANGAFWMTVPVDLKHSASRLIKDIHIDRSKAGTKFDWPRIHWETLRCHYTQTPYFKRYADFFYDMYFNREWGLLSDLNFHQLGFFIEALGIKVRVEKESQLGFAKKKSGRVLEHCLRFKADLCVTGCQGRDYIDETPFKNNHIKVYYQSYQHPAYTQNLGGFVSHLSIVDLLFNHGPDSGEIIVQGNATKKDVLKLAREVHALG